MFLMCVFWSLEGTKIKHIRFLSIYTSERHSGHIDRSCHIIHMKWIGVRRRVQTLRLNPHTKKKVCVSAQATLVSVRARTSSLGRTIIVKRYFHLMSNANSTDNKQDLFYSLLQSKQVDCSSVNKGFPPLFQCLYSAICLLKYII